MRTPKERYEKRVNVYKRKLELYTAKSSNTGNYKLLVFFTGLLGAAVFFFLKLYILMAAVILIFGGLFVYLSTIHNTLIKSKNYYQAMLQINQMCLKRAIGEWNEFTDIGEEFLNPQHDYTYDLDIFGKGSLFQMLNMTASYSGRHKLAELFLNPLKEKEEIYNRQEALQELAKKLLFRHRLFSNGLILNKNTILTDGTDSDKKRKKTLLDTMNKLDDVYSWVKKEKSLYSSPKFKLFIFAMPAFSFIMLILGIMGLVPVYVPVALYILQFILIGFRAESRNKTFELVEKYSDTLKVYKSLLKKFETEKFSSGYINSLKNNLKDDYGNPAWRQIEKLSKIWELIANRYNLMHAIINIATLWDFHCLLALENWKKGGGKYVEKWFDIIGEVEALCSLSLMCHDNPEYVMPRICDKNNLRIEALHLGHPLLSKGRKCNDIKINSAEPILLITGSNMSGKSTFLRTVGVSLVLTYLGLPVCAESFTCPVLKVYACMRTSDNLGQSVSSFYAELLRVKMIVEAVQRGEKVFFLLDEIFKGTNSADRHTGAKMLINQLDKKGAWGLVSTHDLELADMENESKGRIRNYHFKEYYKDNQIFFDYQLRKGVSDTKNAIYLMKMAGVNVEDISPQ